METAIGLTIAHKVATIDGMDVTVDADGAGGLVGTGLSAKAFAAPQETGLVGRTIGAAGTFFLTASCAGVAKGAFSAFFVGKAGHNGCSAAFTEDKQTTKQKQTDERPTKQGSIHDASLLCGICWQVRWIWRKGSLIRCKWFLCSIGHFCRFVSYHNSFPSPTANTPIQIDRLVCCCRYNVGFQRNIGLRK